MGNSGEVSAFSRTVELDMTRFLALFLGLLLLPSAILRAGSTSTSTASQCSGSSATAAARHGNQGRHGAHSRRVLAADTGEPLRKAQVRATSAELRENRLAATDANGVDQIREVPAGRYQLTASKGSFVQLHTEIPPVRGRQAARSRRRTDDRQGRFQSPARRAHYRPV